MGWMAAGLSKVSSASSTSSQSIFESDIFKRLFASSEGAAAGIDTTEMTTAANDLFTQGQGFLGNLQGISEGTDVSGQFLEGRITGDSGLVDEQITGLGEDLSEFFGRMNTQITSEAVGGGGLGGGRQGVAQGEAMRTVGREFQRGSTAIRMADLDARQRAAEGLTSGKLSAAELGIRGGESQYNLANAATMAPLSPFLTLAQILGGPTTLTESEAQSKSRTRSLSGSG